MATPTLTYQTSSAVYDLGTPNKAVLSKKNWNDYRQAVEKAQEQMFHANICNAGQIRNEPESLVNLHAVIISGRPLHFLLEIYFPEARGAEPDLIMVEAGRLETKSEGLLLLIHEHERLGINPDVLHKIGMQFEITREK